MITALLKKPQTNDEKIVMVEFPCNNIYLSEKLCEIDITDIKQNICYALKVDEEYSCLSVLNKKLINVDEFNFLARKLDSFEGFENSQFQAVVFAKKASEIKDMINLSFNLQNFTVITDFSDISKIGREHYINMYMGMTEGEAKKIDFKKIGQDLISNNKDVVTDYGVLFENNLPMDIVYNGKTLPEFLDGEYTLSVIVKSTNSDLTETIFLPTDEISIQKAMLRLEMDSKDCKIAYCDNLTLPEALFSLLKDVGNISNLNCFAKSVIEFEPQDYLKLEAICDLAQTTNITDITSLSACIDSFIFVPEIKTAKEYGRYMIQISERYEYDENLHDYYDYEKYGKQRIVNENGAFSQYGYVCCKVNLEEILNQASAEVKTIKFYSPLEITTYEDGEVEPSYISSNESVRYVDAIMKAIYESHLPSEIDKGLMEYFDKSKMVARKVTYAYPTVEEYDDQLFGVMIVNVKGELNDNEINILTEFFSGQLADGWGKGFEQHPIKTHDGDIYVSFWQSGSGYFIKREEEFIAEHKQDFGMKM
jgi:hypothetical protein